MLILFFFSKLLKLLNETILYSYYLFNEITDYTENCRLAPNKNTKSCVLTSDICSILLLLYIFFVINLTILIAVVSRL